MRIADMLARGRPTVSFEFMAPRDESEVDVLERTIAALAGNAPDWVSVTYRRATGHKTLELVTRIKRQYHLEAMAHLTCANTRDETRKHLNWMEREGVANVLALRGDPPGSGLPFEAVDPQLTHGLDRYFICARTVIPLERPPSFFGLFADKKGSADTHEGECPAELVHCGNTCPAGIARAVENHSASTHGNSARSRGVTPCKNTDQC